MAQQAARFLMKTVKAIGRGHEAKFPMAYLNKIKEAGSKVCRARHADDFANLDMIEDAISMRALALIGDTMLTLAKNKETKFSILLNEKYSQEITAMTKAHFMYLAFIFFKKHIEEAAF
jgi:hypothetical protein